MEVAFDHITGNRIRHGAKLLRWRDDKEPEECLSPSCATDPRARWRPRRWRRRGRAGAAGLADHPPRTTRSSGRPGARAEVYAYGLRNPYRWSFDRLTGDMYVGDVGGGINEEITFIPRARERAAPTSAGPACGHGAQTGCTPAGSTSARPSSTRSSPDVVIGATWFAIPRSPRSRAATSTAASTAARILLGARAPAPRRDRSPRSASPRSPDSARTARAHLYVSSLNGPVYRLDPERRRARRWPVGDFAQPVSVAALPGDPQRLFVAEIGRRVRNRDGSLFLDLTGLVRDIGGEQGLLSGGGGPRLCVERKAVRVLRRQRRQSPDRRVHAHGSPNASSLSTRKPVLTITHAQADNHNGGQLLFGPDGYLYLVDRRRRHAGRPRGRRSEPRLAARARSCDWTSSVAAPAASGDGRCPVRDTSAPRIRVRVKRRQRRAEAPRRGRPTCAATRPARCAGGGRASNRQAALPASRCGPQRTGGAGNPAGAAEGAAQEAQHARAATGDAAWTPAARTSRAARDGCRRQPLPDRLPPGPSSPLSASPATPAPVNHRSSADQ